MGERSIRLLTAFTLAAMALAVFHAVGRHSFVGFDDARYVAENPRVRAGLSAEGAAWAFRTLYFSNWHPLTWLSHMADVSLFGLEAGWHHRVNVLIHAANGALLFLALGTLSGSLWRSAFVAAVFVVHPLHVESVAWVSERKDVLSTLFFLLALLQYRAYATRGGMARYGAVVLFFVLGLMSKPMVVTLPFVLLLLDWWPLGRWSPSGEAGQSLRALGRLVLEKVPLLALSAASCAVTYAAQIMGGSVEPWNALPLAPRLLNAVASYGSYAWKTVWPASLAVYYPYPVGGPDWRTVAAGALLLAGMSYLSWREAGRRPYIAVGWLWYLGTLVPVIGLVQVGGQALADRYMYVPMTGLLVMAAWGIPDLAPGRLPRKAVPALAVCAILALGVAARQQAGYWRDAVTLFGRALTVTRGNWVAENNFAKALEEEGRLDEALVHYRRSLRIRPDYAVAHNNLGAVLGRLGSLDAAIDHFLEAARLDPENAVAHHNLGRAYAVAGRDDLAIRHLRESLRIRPDNPAAMRDLETVLGHGSR